MTDEAGSREIRTQIEIAADADRVWEVLMDFASYPDWHPTMTISGDADVGRKLSVHMDVPGLPPMKFKPAVLRSNPPQEFAWLGSLFIPGVFYGEHIFEIEVLSANRTLFVQRELFSGVLAGATLKRIRLSTRQAFEAGNKALKVRAERRNR